MPLPLLGVAAGVTIGQASNVAAIAATPEMEGSKQGSWQRTPILWPTPDAIIQAHLRRFLGQDAATVACSQQGIAYHFGSVNLWGKSDHGVHSEIWNRVSKLYQWWLTPDLIWQAYYRGLLQEGEQWDYLQHFGVSDGRVQKILSDLSKTVPPPSDLLRFSHKEAFYPEIANKYKFYDEYPVNAEKWMRAHGYDWGPGFKIIRDGKEVDSKWLDLYNAAEWQPISPTQAYRFTHKIREYWINKKRWPTLDLKPWTTKETAEWLRIADYPPGVRDYLIADSYNVIGRIDLRRMVRVGYIPDDADGRKEVLNRYMDMGFTELDSKTMTDYTFLTESPANKVNKAYTRFRTQVLNSYKVGTVTRTMAKELLMRPFIGTQREAELSKENEMYLDSVDIQVNQEQVNRAIQTLRQDLLEGAITVDDARASLANMQIAQPRINNYIARWSIDLSRARKVLSVNKIIDLYKRRIITLDEAFRRGRNLGYSQIDMQLMIAAADQDVANAMARAEIKQQKEAKAAIREAHRDADHARMHRYMEWQDITRVVSPTTAGQEFKKGIIDESKFRGLLDSLEWPDEWISPFVELYRP